MRVFIYVRSHFCVLAEMSDPGPAGWDKIMSMPARNANSQKYEKMLPKTKALLEEFYRPYNEKLAKMLKDDRYLWKSETVEQAASQSQGQTQAASQQGTSTSSQR